MLYFNDNKEKKFNLKSVVGVMKNEKQYEEQILKSLNKVPFEMKKIKFILFLLKYVNKLKKEKATIIKLLFLTYTIIISILYFWRN
jgi:hypothetical protein